MKYAFLILIVFLTGCIKDITDATNIDGVRITNLNGIYALPLVNSKLSLEDLITNRDEKNFIRDNSQGFLSIVFDTISYTLDVAQFVSIPPVSASETQTIPPPPSFASIPDGTEVPILTNQSGQKSLTIGSYELDKIDLENGNLSIVTKNSSSHSMSYTIELTDLKNAGGIPLTIQTTGAGNQTFNANLANYSWDLTAGGTTNNVLRYKITAKITKSGNIPPSDIGFDLNLNGISYKTIEGYFGNTDFSNLNVDLPFDLFKTNTSGGTLEVTNPLIKINFENDFRLPIAVSLTGNLFNVKYNDNSIDNVSGILSTPYTLQAAPSATVPFQDSLIYTNVTPSLGTIIAKNPKQIFFGLNTKLNPAGKTSVRNIIRKTDKLKVRAFFELPLKAKAKNFKLDKIVPVSISDIENKDSIIDLVELKLVLINTMPLEAKVQLEFIDPNNSAVVVKTLLPSNYIIMNGSSGSVPTKTETTITLNGAEWSVLVAKKVKEMRISNEFSTAGGGATFEVLKRDQFIQMNIGSRIFLKAKY